MRIYLASSKLNAKRVMLREQITGSGNTIGLGNIATSQHRNIATSQHRNIATSQQQRSYPVPTSTIVSALASFFACQSTAKKLWDAQSRNLGFPLKSKRLS